ncbi:MAG: hypothetical protein AAGG38_14525 [Planctomycetota bacterium]
MENKGSTRCSACGYDLMGLGREGVCPECGNAFDTLTKVGIRVDSARIEAHRRGDRLLYLMKFWSLVAAAGVSVLLGMWAAQGAVNPAGPRTVGALFAGVFGFAAFVTFYSERSG